MLHRFQADEIQLFYILYVMLIQCWVARYHPQQSSVSLYVL